MVMAVLLWLLVVMASINVDTYGHGRYHCGYSWLWPLLLWILLVMADTIVDSHGQASNIVDTHGHGR